MSNVDLGPRKTVFIMVIVVGCFAVLWPKVFYPMYAGSFNNVQTKSQDKSEGCCDVIWETDINAIRIMNDLCGNILKDLRETDPRIQLAFESGKLPNDVIEKCRSKVLATCNVDIALFLKENVMLGRNYRQILDELRSVNSSLCLKYNFGVTPDELGFRYRHTIDSSKIQNVRQERPAHLHPEMLHPALRERGRAIPPSSSPSSPPPRVMPGRPGPVPGMRPTLGGAGHVVPPPKTTTSTMGIVMPIYTIGIVIFFTYTLMKVRANRKDLILDQTNKCKITDDDDNDVVTDTKLKIDLKNKNKQPMFHIGHNRSFDEFPNFNRSLITTAPAMSKTLKKYNFMKKKMWVKKSLQELCIEDAETLNNK